MAEPLAEWAVEIDADGTRQALEEVLAAFRADLEALDESARDTRLSVNTTGLDAARAQVEKTRKDLAGGIDVALPGTIAAPEVGKPGKIPAPEVGLPGRIPAPEVEPIKPVTIQGAFASEPIKLAREELLATQKTAEGVGASLRLTKQALEELEAPTELREVLQGIQKDFLAGRATATEALRAIADVQGAATEHFRDQERQKLEATRQAKQAEVEAVRAAEQRKREEEKRTAEMAAASRDRLQSLTVIGQGMAGTAGSISASFLQMRLDTERAAGATEFMLHNLNQAQGAIPHLVGIGTSIGAMMSGGPLGMITGGLGIIGSLVGAIASLTKPPPLPEPQKETAESTFSRVQQGALRGDSLLRINEDSRGYLKEIRDFMRSRGATIDGAPVTRP